MLYNTKYNTKYSFIALSSPWSFSRLDYLLKVVQYIITRKLFMLLQDSFASARLHRVHKFFLLPKSVVHYSYWLKLNNIIAQKKTINTERLYYPWLISFI